MPADVPSLEAALDRIRAFARVMGWRPHRLAVEAGVSEVTTRRLFDRDWAPTSTTIRAIEAIIPASWRIGDPAPAEERAA